jgi:hypothetical protein
MTPAGTEKPKQSCFAIAPIGSKDSETRRRSDKVLKHIFKKALDEKYEVIRGDEIDEPGMITSQVLRAVQDAHLVVADLTEHNPNVLYELAVRHAIEKPIIHVIEPRLSKIPFDIGGFRTIEFDLTDPDSIEIAVEKLRKFAEQAEAGNWGETPIKLANIMRASKADSPEMLLLKQVVEGISMISTRLENLESWRATGFYGDQPPSFYQALLDTVPWDQRWRINLRNERVHQSLDPDAVSSTVDDIFDESKQAATTAKEDATGKERRSPEEPVPVNPAKPADSQKTQAEKPRPKRDSK